MMGSGQFIQGALFYEFSLEEHVPATHLLRAIDRVLKRILRLDRLRLRGPNGARDEFHLAATAQNLRKLAKLVAMPRLAAA